MPLLSFHCPAGASTTLPINYFVDMPPSVRNHVAWSMTAIVAKNGCLILTYMLLARLLDPAAFGCIAITMVAMGLAFSFVDSGFTSVVIRHPVFNRTVFSSLYWFNLSIGALAALLLVSGGYAAAAIYSDARLVRLMATAGLALWFASVGQQFSSILQRHLAFRQIAAIEIAGALPALTVAALRALAGAGPAAYFEGLVVGNATAAFLSFFFGRRYFVPLLRFSRHDLAQLLPFGLFNTAERCVGYLAFNLEKPLLGRLFSMDLLGLYTIVNQLVTRPVMLFSGAFSRVAYPLYANLQKESTALNALYINYTGKIALLVFPVYGFLVLFGDTVIPLLFGEHFSGAYAFILPLCVLGALWSIGNPFGSYLMALNRAKTGFFFNGASAILTLSIFLVGSRFSLQVMLWLWVGGVVCIMLPAEWTIRYRLTGMSWRRYLCSFFPHALVVTGIAALFFLVRSTVHYQRPPAITIGEMGVYCALYGSYGAWMYRQYRQLREVR